VSELINITPTTESKPRSVRIGIVICARYRDCGGGKCFRALRERQGAFSRYAAGDRVEIAGYWLFLPNASKR
jgi:hypothetical protein